jgi:hypothetical protein
MVTYWESCGFTCILALHNIVFAAANVNQLFPCLETDTLAGLYEFFFK